MLNIEKLDKNGFDNLLQNALTESEVACLSY